MRKHDFSICNNKDADQLHGYTNPAPLFTLNIVQSIYNFNLKIPSLTMFCGFVLDLVGNSEDRFSHNLAHRSNIKKFNIHCELGLSQTHPFSGSKTEFSNFSNFLIHSPFFMEFVFDFSFSQESCCEKTCLCSFLLTQSRLYSHRRWLEA